MPCIFCIATFALIAGAVSAAAIDRMEGELAKIAEGPLRKLADTESVMKLRLDVPLRGKKVPVDVTVYKEHGRVRIQILTHGLSRQEIEEIEDMIANAIDATIVTRSDPEEEEKVQEAAEEAEVLDAEPIPVDEPKRAPPVKRRRGR